MKTTLYRNLSKCFHSKNVLDMRLHAVYGKRTQYSQGVDISDLPIDDQAVLYVHWPYCSKRCTYCNFNKYISRNVDNERMTRCLMKETQTLIECSHVSRINSIFFGGGTPSLATPRTIAKVIETVTKTTWLHGNAEVTLEVNPTHLETGKLRDFRSAGVNRVSIGVQALNDSDLKLLGREHDTQDSMRCIEEARNLFPGCVSIDVIFGRPGQTLGSWISELQKILAVSDQHISLYQLTLERGTQLFKWVQNGLIELPDEDAMADMYLEAVKTLEIHGFKQYEVSNFAKNGATSDHNTAYWTI
ncbi:radical S-adenosyl methionine domain-containing protein 1, mitochondrial-like [Argopecten irradians]|uniref:radical S-adenosyl methionine domain-containing protein 1, mitochondrial-like n=1 Tax=Argopecten irradians TaxID=31199 RepID=UPI003712B51D